MSLPGNPCVTNADCTGGQNGRCLCAPAFGSPDSGNADTLYNDTFCSYDQCFADTDCHPRVPCDCRDDGVPGSPNVCMSTSNCAVDPDCPSTGFCSPTGAGYFCHTPNDTCIDEVDCPPAAATLITQSACLFEADSGVWECVQVPERL
jgi:hypothetical protein